MSETTRTTHYALYKPNVNADSDLWGDHWNWNADTLDTTLFSIASSGGVTSWNTRVGAVTLQGTDVTAALGYTPYNATNPSGYQTAAQVSTSLSPYAPLASPTLTGDPRAPTATAGDNDNSIATTAFVAAAIAPLAPLNAPIFTGDARLSSSPAPGDNDLSIATTAFVAAALGGVPGGAVIGDVAPTASPGALWWDSVGGNLYVLYQDPNTTQWVAATNMAGLANAATQTDVLAAQNNTGRNLIHNSMFNVAQRGAGPFTTNNAYTLDRWTMILSNDTFSVSQGPLPPGSLTGVGDEAQRYYLSAVVTGSAIGGSYSALQQPIEGVSRTSGKTITVSFYCGLGAGTANVGVELVQIFGSGGSPSSPVTSALQNIAVSSTWARYTATFSLPSISGKTMGTLANDFLMLRLWLSNPANAVGRQTATFGIWGIQLEIGSVATPLAKRDPADELALCQRFYQIGHLLWGGYITSGTYYAAAQFLVQMRATPTTTLVNDVSGGFGARSVTALGVTGAYISAAVASAGAGILNSDFTASADL